MKRLLLLLAFVSQLWAVPTFVQATGLDTESSSTSAKSFGSLPTVGNLIVAACSANSQNTTNIAPALTIADNQGNTYLPTSEVRGRTGVWMRMFYAIASTSSGTFTVTCTSNHSGSAVAITIAEYSGMASTLDTVYDQQAPAAANNSSTNSTRWSVLTNTANQVIIGMAFVEPDLGAIDGWTMGTGFTSRFTTASGNSVAVEDKIVSSAGTYNSSITANCHYDCSALMLMMGTFVAATDTLPANRFVQGVNTGLAGGGTSVSTSFAKLPVVGNLLVITCSQITTGATPTLTLTDNQTGNTYSPAPSIFGGSGNFIASFYGVVVGSTGTFTGTCTSTIGTYNPAISMLEFSGLTILDQTATSTAVVTGSTITSNNLTTTKDTEVLVSCMSDATGGVHIVTPGTSYTIASMTNGAISESSVVDCQYRYVSSIGTYSSTMTINTTGTLLIHLASYGGSGGGASTGVGPPIIWIL